MDDVTFSYSYKQDGHNRLSLDYSPEADEKLDLAIRDGHAFLSLNRPGMITLAQILIKIAKGDYAAGYHIHLHKDFNADLPECVVVVLSPDDAPPYR